MQCFEQSQWISPDAAAIAQWDGTFLLGRNFDIEEKPVKAILKIAGVGIYRCTINGVFTDDAVLKPITTDYRKIILYDEFDITRHIVIGNNVLRIELGGGNYSAKDKYCDWRMCNLGLPKADVRLEIETDSGEKRVIVSDREWHFTTGKCTFSCIYDGETHDERLNPEKSEWHSAVECVPPCRELVKNTAPPIRVCASNKYERSIKTGEGEYTFDFGKNRSGWVRITVCGECGDVVCVTHSERINDDGTLNLQSNRAALNTDKFIIAGKPQEMLEPGFTYHGFRYAHVSLSNPNTKINDIVQCHVHSDIKTTGHFSCGNKCIEEIHSACVLTQTNALMGVPLDCVQRDERLGWLGDAYVTAESCLYNFDMKAFYESWVRDIRFTGEENGDISHIAPWPQRKEAGSPDFSSGYLIIIYEHYKMYGDKKIVDDNFFAIKGYVDFLIEGSDEFILPKGRYGDWKSLVPEFQRGDPYYINTMYLYMDILLLIKFAQITRFDADEYKKVADKMRKKLISLYYDSEKHCFGSGSQFSNSFALLLGLFPEKEEKPLLNNLLENINQNNGHTTCGIFGTRFLFEVLEKYCKREVLLALLLKKDYPGWLDMLKHNTTLTETWDGNSLSLGHCMFGSIDSKMYRTLGGIEINHTADYIITLKPFINDYTDYVKASVETVYGNVMCCWKREHGEIIIDTQLPQRVSARLVLPDGSVKTDICGSRKWILH